MQSYIFKLCVWTITSNYCLMSCCWTRVASCEECFIKINCTVLCPWLLSLARSLIFQCCCISNVSGIARRLHEAAKTQMRQVAISWRAPGHRASIFLSSSLNFKCRQKRLNLLPFSQIQTFSPYQSKNYEGFNMNLRKRWNSIAEVESDQN